MNFPFYWNIIYIYGVLLLGHDPQVFHPSDPGKGHTVKVDTERVSSLAPHFIKNDDLGFLPTRIFVCTLNHNEWQPNLDLVRIVNSLSIKTIPYPEQL